MKSKLSKKEFAFIFRKAFNQKDYEQLWILKLDDKEKYEEMFIEMIRPLGKKYA